MLAAHSMIALIQRVSEARVDVDGETVGTIEAGLLALVAVQPGDGETQAERIDSLLRLRDLHDEFGHIQEIIVQNFRAKTGTRMVEAPEPDLDELLWTIAVVYCSSTRTAAEPSAALTLPTLDPAGEPSISSPPPRPAHPPCV